MPRETSSAVSVPVRSTSILTNSSVKWRDRAELDACWRSFAPMRRTVVSAACSAVGSTLGRQLCARDMPGSLGSALAPMELA
jgi:hypothetical protein